MNVSAGAAFAWLNASMPFAMLFGSSPSQVAPGPLYSLIRALSANVRYLFRVCASTDAGRGAFSEPTAPIRLEGSVPPPPPPPIAEPVSPTSVVLRWNRTHEHGGYPLRAYAVSACAANERWCVVHTLDLGRADARATVVADDDARTEPHEGTQHEARLSNLLASVPYRFKVRSQTRALLALAAVRALRSCAALSANVASTKPGLFSRLDAGACDQQPRPGPVERAERAPRSHRLAADAAARHQRPSAQCICRYCTALRRHRLLPTARRCRQLSLSSDAVTDDPSAY